MFVHIDRSEYFNGMDRDIILVNFNVATPQWICDKN